MVIILKCGSPDKQKTARPYCCHCNPWSINHCNWPNLSKLARLQAWLFGN